MWSLPGQRAAHAPLVPNLIGGTLTGTMLCFEKCSSLTLAAPTRPSCPSSPSCQEASIPSCNRAFGTRGSTRRRAWHIITCVLPRKTLASKGGWATHTTKRDAFPQVKCWACGGPIMSEFVDVPRSCIPGALQCRCCRMLLLQQQLRVFRVKNLAHSIRVSFGKRHC